MGNTSKYPLWLGQGAAKLVLIAASLAFNGCKSRESASETKSLDNFTSINGKTDTEKGPAVTLDIADTSAQGSKVSAGGSTNEKGSTLLTYQVGDYLYAVDETGNRLFSANGPSAVQNSGSLVSFLSQGYLYSVAKSGKTVLSGISNVGQVITQGNIVAYVYSSTLYAYNSAGNLIVSVDNPTSIQVGDNVIAYVSESKLYAYSSNGEQIVGGAYNPSYFKVGPSFVAYVDNNQSLYVLNTSGVSIVNGEYIGNGSIGDISDQILTYTNANGKISLRNIGGKTIGTLNSPSGVQISGNIVAYFYGQYLYALNSLGTQILGGIFNPTSVQVGQNILSYIDSRGYLRAVNNLGNSLGVAESSPLSVGAGDNILFYVNPNRHLYSVSSTGNTIVNRFYSPNSVNTAGDIVAVAAADGDLYAYNVKGSTILGRTSNVSSIQVGYTPGAIPPGTPTNLVARPTSPSRIEATWQGSSGYTAGFKVSIVQGTSPADCSSGIDVGKTFSRLFPGLNSDTTYTVSVCAYNASGNISRAVFSSATTDPLPPPQVTSLTLNSTTRFSLNAVWTNGGGSTTGYTVAIAKGNVPSLNCASGATVGTATSYQFGSVTNDSSYTVAVCAVNRVGVFSPVRLAVGSPAAVTTALNKCAFNRTPWVVFTSTLQKQLVSGSNTLILPIDASSIAMGLSGVGVDDYAPQVSINGISVYDNSNERSQKAHDIFFPSAINLSPVIKPGANLINASARNNIGPGSIVLFLTGFYGTERACDSVSTFTGPLPPYALVGNSAAAEAAPNTSYTVSCNWGGNLSCGSARNDVGGCAYVSSDASYNYTYRCQSGAAGTVKNFCNLVANSSDVRCRNDSTQIQSTLVRVPVPTLNVCTFNPQSTWTIFSSTLSNRAISGSGTIVINSDAKSITARVNRLVVDDYAPKVSVNGVVVIDRSKEKPQNAHWITFASPVNLNLVRGTNRVQASAFNRSGPGSVGIGISGSYLSSQACGPLTTQTGTVPISP